MEYYKQIANIPASAEQILNLITVTRSPTSYVKAIDRLEQDNLCKLLQIDLSQCDDYNIMLVYFPPGSTVKIHTDRPTSGPLDKVNKAIFVPLTFCENLYWDWWECTNDKHIHNLSSNEWKTISTLDYLGARKVKSLISNEPMITDIGSWHSLVNKGTQTAIGISIRLMPWSWEKTSYDKMPPMDGITLL